MRKISTVFFVALVVFTIASMANAQVLSNSTTTQITATKGESIGVSATTTNPAFNLDTDLTTQTASVAITSSWNLKPSRATNVWVCATMPLPMNGTGTNSDTIAQANVNAKPNSGTYGPINATISNCGLTNGVLVNTYPLSPSTQANHKNISKSDTLSLQLSLTAGQLSALQADTYTGTINIIAYTN